MISPEWFRIGSRPVPVWYPIGTRSNCLALLLDQYFDLYPGSLRGATRSLRGFAMGVEGTLEESAMSLRRVCEECYSAADMLCAACIDKYLLRPR